MKLKIKYLLNFALITLAIFSAPALADTVDDEQTQVSISAPPVITGAFDAAINIQNANDLDSGQFDISFDPGVVNITAIKDGNIDGTAVPIDSWNFADADTVSVLFNLPDTTGVSGSGNLAMVCFEIAGSQGEACTLDISNGLLVDTSSNETNATWLDCNVTVGVPVMVNASDVILDSFEAEIDIHTVTDLDSGQFDLSFDPDVINVTAIKDGNINGTIVPIDLWDFIDTDTIRVVFNLPNTTGVNGSGQLATVCFEMKGSQGDASILDISNGTLVDSASKVIPTTWTDAGIAIGVALTISATEEISDTFDVTIDIANISDMNGGQFDLSFDPGVVNVTNVIDGSINDTDIPITDWRFMDADTIRVLFRLAGVDGVSGSGYATKINFEVTGSQNDTSILDLSNVTFSNTNADKILAVWTDVEVTV